MAERLFGRAPTHAEPEEADRHLLPAVMGGQFVAQMITERNEAEQHGQSFEWADFIPQFLSSTFENWQSEFLQLIWQAAGLALLFFWGSSQSRESGERIEAKLDRLLEERGINPDEITRKVNESV